ncbi:hypothetical protein NSP_1540 [Nodularia spumigena CCY9414]|nr:hypothetical protein NSP_1540 [Nodularia spumigena CCY9414]
MLYGFLFFTPTYGHYRMSKFCLGAEKSRLDKQNLQKQVILD